MSKENDPVAQNCDHRSFKSKSKGRGRRRKNPEYVELVGYNGRYYMVNEDDKFKGIDVIAQELLEGVIPEGVNLEQEFIDRVRRV